MAETLAIDVTHRFASGFTLELQRTFEPGLTLLKGPSGAGKTTTLHLIAGLLRPDRGHVKLGSASWVDAASWVQPERRGVGLVFQHGALFPHLTALENVAFALRGSSRRSAQGWLERMRVGGLADRYPHTLSSGETQRVALARALARQPRVLLLDEPFAAVDDELRAELFADLQAHLVEHPLPCVLVTHDALPTDAPICTLRHGKAAP